MDRVYGANVSVTPPVTPFPGKYGFTQGNSELTQFLPTSPGSFWFNYITESFRNVIVAAGLTPDLKNFGQFYQAVEILIASARS